MDATLAPLYWLVETVIWLYIYVLIAGAILSWLVAFNVVNTRNRFVYTVSDFLQRLTEPALRPIRRTLPAMGGIDLSPLVLILALFFLLHALRYWGLLVTVVLIALLVIGLRVLDRR